jgi:uncharacterized RDD family membrane protein YckC
MPYIQFLDNIHIWYLFIIIALLFTIASELGFRVGKFMHERLGKEQNPMIGTILGASLGLLAFFLAFTFNMAVSRYDARKNLVLEEANAIETTYLRAKLLPESYRTEAQDLLSKYVNIRAQLQDTNSLEKAQQILEESEALRNMLWTKVIKITEEGKYSITTTLFINSLNNMFDLHSKRIYSGLYNRISISIFATLYFVGFLTMSLMGYEAGLSGERSPIAAFMLILTFSVVLTLITDLERPRQEIFSVSQQTMVDLNNKINQTP